MTRIAPNWLTTPATRAVLDGLGGAGKQLLFVGGCVRDALLDVPASDLDLATDAHPQEVMGAAEAAGLKAIPTGIDHGTVTVVSDGRPFEITTFRKDIATDGRRAVVAFSGDVMDDAQRRDFTINALYADPDGNVIDPLGGLPDLKARYVRFIGDPTARIAEDYLRSLRFFRFTAWYGDPSHGIDADGLAAVAAGLDGLEMLAAERVTHEVLRLLSAPDPAPAFAAMCACGAAGRVLPGAGPDGLSVLAHLEQVYEIPPDPLRRLVATGAEIDGLRLSKRDQKHIMHLLRLLQNDETKPAALGFLEGEAVARDIILLRAAMTGTAPDTAVLQLIAHGARQIFPVQPVDILSDVQGKALGERLAQLQSRWIDSDFTLTRQELLS